MYHVGNKNFFCQILVLQEEGEGGEEGVERVRGSKIILQMRRGEKGGSGVPNYFRGSEITP